MNSKIIASSIVIGIVLLGAFLYMASSPDNSNDTEKPVANQQPNTNDTQPASPNNQESTDPKSMYTLEEVATHSTRDDCWTVINDNVYDLTPFIARHEGGDNILSACGNDATSYFRGEQPGQLGGVNNHTTSSRALAELENLQIGSLVR